MNTPSTDRIVLLVEDSDDDAFFFERAFSLGKVPGQLARVANGAEAVEYLQNAAQDSLNLSQTHFVFLDLKLPVLSGFEVLKWIKQRGISVEVVVLSGSDIESDVDQARGLGASDYLIKPISAHQIKKRLFKEAVAN